MNDKDREQWIMNEEGLYNWWRMSRMGVKRFIRENRVEITRIINRCLNGERG